MADLVADQLVILDLQSHLLSSLSLSRGESGVPRLSCCRHAGASLNPSTIVVWRAHFATPARARCLAIAWLQMVAGAWHSDGTCCNSRGGPVTTKKSVARGVCTAAFYALDSPLM
ncbi:hypothetical protein [Accumulibacter sp.]|uniref:hypothetical protein n=1 Tax=Accumulibacter sp. TaxID=2053492 RepID=UPI00262D0E9A|nr:hypothetical protein [Accumulibacter sp.]